MKISKIYGDNYSGYSDKTRDASRGIVLDGDMVLLSYETKTGMYMIPGGGKESDEDDAECCIREVAEETGYLISVSLCTFEMHEYYENWKYVSRYFTGTVTGKCERKLTKRESEVGMEPRWVKCDEAIEIFSHHEEYRDINEERRGIYLREYTALCHILKETYGH